jgi:hypothetical protein
VSVRAAASARVVSSVQMDGMDAKLSAASEGPDEPATMKISASQPKPVTKMPVLASGGALVVELRKESRFERHAELDNITLSAGLALSRLSSLLRPAARDRPARRYLRPCPHSRCPRRWRERVRNRRSAAESVVPRKRALRALGAQA